MRDVLYAAQVKILLQTRLGIYEGDTLWLMEVGLFPAPKCSLEIGPHWNRKKVRAWIWGAKNAPRLTQAIEQALGRKLRFGPDEE